MGRTVANKVRRVQRFEPYPARKLCPATSRPRTHAFRRLGYRSRIGPIQIRPGRAVRPRPQGQGHIDTEPDPWRQAPDRHGQRADQHRGRRGGRLQTDDAGSAPVAGRARPQGRAGGLDRRDSVVVVRPLQPSLCSRRDVGRSRLHADLLRRDRSAGAGHIALRAAMADGKSGSGNQGPAATGQSGRSAGGDCNALLRAAGRC